MPRNWDDLDVKIKHFLAILGTLAISGCAGLMAWMLHSPVPEGPEWRPLPPEDWSHDAFPEFDESLFLSWRGEEIGEAEIGDADPTLVYRIRARQYLTDESVSKVWVDLDRDWMWDVRIQFDGDETHLWHSEGDNEIYGERLRWTGAGWVPAPVVEATHAPRAAPKASVAVVTALGFHRRPMSTAVLDAQPGQPWKLDVYPGTDGLADYADLDLNRDGMPDQRWHLAQDPIVVDLLGDGGSSFTWTGSALVPKP